MGILGAGVQSRDVTRRQNDNKGTVVLFRFPLNLYSVQVESAILLAAFCVLIESYGSHISLTGIQVCSVAT